MLKYMVVSIVMSTHRQSENRRFLCKILVAGVADLSAGGLHLIKNGGARRCKKAGDTMPSKPLRLCAHRMFGARILWTMR